MEGVKNVIAPHTYQQAITQAVNNLQFLGFKVRLLKPAHTTHPGKAIELGFSITASISKLIPFTWSIYIYLVAASWQNSICDRVHLSTIKASDR